MKKVLSFVLVLALVLSSFSMAFAVAPADVQGKTCEDAVEALTGLGVISGYTDGTYKPENPVNRAEAAKLIVAALGLEDYAAGITSTNFTDLDGFGWAVGYIGYASQLGLVKGVGNNKFNPAGPVTYEQWATMLVRALGYTDEVLPGTWPANYMIKAQSLGIMKDIKAAGNAAANRGDVAIMLYNNLGQSIGTIDKDGVFQRNIGRDGVLGTDTMLSRLEKRSTANYNVFTDTDLANVKDGLNLRSYLGANVKYYLNDDDEIIGIKDCKTKFLTGDFDGTDKFTVGDTDYVFRLGGLNAGIPVAAFDNGEVIGGGTNLVAEYAAATYGGGANSLDNVTIACEYSGKTITSLSSILFWTVSAADQFEAADLSTSKCKLLNKDFTKDNNKEIDTTSFELLGVSSLDKIAEDNIVEVYVAPTANKITRVTVGTQVIEGAVSKINSGNDKFTIDGTAYKQADSFVTIGGDVPELGDSGKAFLNYEGKLAYWDVNDSTAGNYAIYEGYDVDSAYGKDTVKIKLFTKEGKEEIYTVKDALKEKVTNVAIGGISTDAIIRFSLNSSNKVDEITTFAASTLTGYASKSGTRLGNTPVKDALVVFIWDTTDKEWTIGSIKDISTDSADDFATARKNAVYCVLDSGKVACVAVDDTAGNSNDTFGIINSLYTKVDESGDKYWGVDGFNDGKELSALTDTSADAGKPYAASTTIGGIYNIKVNNAGKVTGVAFATVGAGQDIEEAVTGSAAFYALGQNSGVAITKVDKSKKEITVTNGGTDTVTYGLTNDVVVYLWDADEEEFVKTDIGGLAKDVWVQLYKTDSDYDGFDVVIAWDNDDNYNPAIVL